MDTQIVWVFFVLQFIELARKKMWAIIGQIHMKIKMVTNQLHLSNLIEENITISHRI